MLGKVFILDYSGLVWITQDQDGSLPSTTIGRRGRGRPYQEILGVTGGVSDRIMASDFAARGRVRAR